LQGGEAEGGGLLQRVGAELRPATLVPGLIAGLVTGLLTVIISASFGALIFSGSLAPFVPGGICVVLTTATVVGALVALGSSYPGSIAYPQDKIAPILALMAASIAAAMPASATPEQIFLTVVAAIIVATLLTGLFMLALGWFRLGGLIRFIPYPVIGGFLAGTGWLLVLGSMRVMTGASISFSALPGLFESDVLVSWLPGAVFALALLLMLRRFKHFLVMPSMLVGAIGLFYVALLLFDVPVAEARARGWLLGPFPPGGIWQFLSWPAVEGADWGVVTGQVASLGTILLVSAIAILLNASGIELAAEEEIDLDRELRVAGAANLGIGLAGGMVGFHALSLSKLVLDMGVRSRIAGLVTAAVCCAVLFLGASILSFFPKAIVGGLLLFLGFSFLAQWIWDAWPKLSRADYAVVVLILIVVGAFGFLPGVGVGVIAAVILFVVKYSTAEVVKHALSGAQHRSNVDRPKRHHRLLGEHGERIHILKLQGFLFFGTANSLLTQVQKRVNDAERPPPGYVLLDFERVRGIDSSAVISMIKMRQLAQRRGFVLVFTSLSDDVEGQLAREGMGRDDEAVFRKFPDLDRGTEWCEEQILSDHDMEPSADRRTPEDCLAELLTDRTHVSGIATYLEPLDVAEGDFLIKQDSPSEDLFFIESGQVSVLLELEHGRSLRLRKMGAGTVVGEVSLYLGRSRTASVVTDRPSRVHRLTGEALARMERDQPQVAAACHLFVARLLAERLSLTDRTLQALLD